MYSINNCFAASFSNLNQDTIYGADLNGGFGSSLESIPDENGDGIDELIIGTGKEEEYTLFSPIIPSSVEIAKIKSGDTPLKGAYEDLSLKEV